MLFPLKYRAQQIMLSLKGCLCSTILYKENVIIFQGHFTNLSFWEHFSKNTCSCTYVLSIEIQQQIMLSLKGCLCSTKWYKNFITLNPKKTGGGGGGPPRHFAQLPCNAQSSRRETLWLFSFKFPAHFDTKFVMPGGTVLKLRNFLYMHVGPKMAPKCDFVYKINANLVFSHSSYKYAYFYSQWLKWICFSIIVLQKVSATNFTEKNNKNKR